MRAHTERLEIATTREREIVDITGDIERIILASKIADGICIVQSQHTTAGIYVNVTEHLESDVLDMLASLAPEGNAYRHNSVDPNAQAHLHKILTGRDATILVTGGKADLGTWEKIQLAEFDGPRRRTVTVKVLGT
jgi:secondary thiamine-phosphate synthase enzyme